MVPPVKVAIVDDHPMIVSGLKSILQSEKVDVVLEAPNGKAFFEQLELAGLVPDICILDINMPTMNGYETAKRIRCSYPSIKILVLSMHNHEYCILRMIKCGAVGYMSKDGHPSEAYEAIRTISEYGYYHPELVLSVLQKNRAEPMKKITEKEETFLKYCCSELTYKEIASSWGVSTRTVDGFRDNLFFKFSIKSRIGLVLFAIQMGIIDIAHPFLAD